MFGFISNLYLDGTGHMQTDYITPPTLSIYKFNGTTWLQEHENLSNWKPQYPHFQWDVMWRELIMLLLVTVTVYVVEPKLWKSLILEIWLWIVYKNTLTPQALPWILTAHIHTFQMPISVEQWRVSVGIANASQSLRSHVTRQSMRNLAPWNILLILLTAPLGAILLPSMVR